MRKPKMRELARVLCAIWATTGVHLDPSRKPDAKPSGEQTTKTECRKLYTDDEAKALVSAAEAVVRVGQLRRKDVMLNSLKVDPARFCNRRIERSNLAYYEAWRISNSFDLTWWTAVQDKSPLDDVRREIYFVRIVDRANQ